MGERMQEGIKAFFWDKFKMLGVILAGFLAFGLFLHIASCAEEQSLANTKGMRISEVSRFKGYAKHQWAQDSRILRSEWKIQKIPDGKVNLYTKRYNGILQHVPPIGKIYVIFTDGEDRILAVEIGKP